MKKFAIALRILFALLILSLGVSAQLKGWGSNDRGKLGIGNVVTPQSSPSDITTPPDATAVSGNSQHTLFLKANGQVFSSGDNSFGQLGNFNVTSQAQVTPGVVTDLIGAIQVSAGAFHSVALDENGAVWSWGRNNNGQIGNGTINNPFCSCVALATRAAISNVVQIHAGGNFTIALKSDGTVWGWGVNTWGQLGDNSILTRPSPVQIGVGVAGFDNIIAISAGDDHAMALKADGTVWVWGRNDYGQGGNGTAGGSILQPAQNTTLSDVTQVSAGSMHNVALKKDGTIWTWGQNAYGQAGNGTFSDDICQCLAVPQQNTMIANPVEIEAFHFGTFTRQSDGSIWAWGRNLEGTMGNGTLSGLGCQCQPSPVQVSVGTGIGVLSSGFSSGYAAIPSFQAGVNPNDTRLSGKSVTIFFYSTTSGGTTGYSSIDPSTTGLNVPAGYTIQNRAPAYNITSAVTAGIKYVCLNISSEYDPSQFALLKILHEEGADLVDRTVSYVFMKKLVCAEASSFGRFVVAKGSSPVSNQLTVSGRVLETTGQAIQNATVY